MGTFFRFRAVLASSAVEAPAVVAPAGTTDPSRQLGLILCFHEQDHKAPVEGQVVSESKKRLGLSESFVVLGMQSTSPSFKDGVEMAHLLAKSADVQRCFAQKWIEYALGPQTTEPTPRLSRRV